MNQKKLLSIIYIGSILPLLSGSITFVYWYLKRIWVVEDIIIKLPAFLSIASYFLFSIITFLLCSIYAAKYKNCRQNIIAPIIIIIMTIPVIILYSSTYESLCKKTFIRIINNNKNLRISSVWSDNFKTSFYTKDKNIIFSYRPVYTFDWTKDNSCGLGCYYKINTVHIDVETSDKIIKTYTLPVIEKGECVTLYLNQIIDDKKTADPESLLKIPFLDNYFFSCNATAQNIYADTIYADEIDKFLMNLQNDPINEYATTFGEMRCYSLAINKLSTLIDSTYKILYNRLKSKTDKKLLEKSQDNWENYYKSETALLHEIWWNGDKLYGLGLGHSILEVQWAFQIARQRLILLKNYENQIPDQEESK